MCGGHHTPVTANPPDKSARCLLCYEAPLPQSKSAEGRGRGETGQKGGRREHEHEEFAVSQTSWQLLSFQDIIIIQGDTALTGMAGQYRSDAKVMPG